MYIMGYIMVLSMTWHVLNRCTYLWNDGDDDDTNCSDSHHQICLV